MIKVVCVLTTLLILADLLQAQHQVVVLKKGEVTARYNVDDHIRYSTSTKRHLVQDIIIELTDTTIITRNDTIPYHHIRLIDVRAKQDAGITMRTIASYMIAAAVLLPVIDLINVTAIQKESYEFNENLGYTSLALASAGVLILVLDKPYQKMGRKKIVRIVDYKSPLYKRPALIQQDILLNPQKN